MQRTPGVIALFAALMLSACLDEDYQITVSAGAAGTGVLPLGYQLGDTVQFVAAERVTSKAGGGPTGPSSASSPNGYSWSTATPSVAEMIAPGRVVMRQMGEDSIAVETANVRRVFRIIVVPRVAALRLVPHEATISPGETLTMDVDPLDASGNVIASIKAIPGLIIARPSPSGLGGYPVIMDQSDVPPFVLRGVQIGTGRVPVALDVYRVALLRDTATIIVR
jgi:hypothetical protein